jgi:acetoin utilization deacetylase AcuC-like enzyme
MSTGSYKAALYTAGGSITAVEIVIKKDVSSAFTLVKPPEHHAINNNATGFCLFNIAIAANYALKTLNIGLIINFDVHHSNDTQEAFTRNPYVLYISIHQYPFFPSTDYLV